MAERLGRTHAELIGSMGHRELIEWIALERIRDQEREKVKQDGLRR